jgi:hypothetical protein
VEKAIRISLLQNMRAALKIVPFSRAILRLFKRKCVVSGTSAIVLDSNAVIELLNDEANLKDE